MKDLTAKDKQTLRRALNNAMDERESFADAYGKSGPAAAKAMREVAAYEALYRKIFGQESERQQFMDCMDRTETVTLEELRSRATAQQDSGEDA